MEPIAVAVVYSLEGFLGIVATRRGVTRVALDQELPSGSDEAGATDVARRAAQQIEEYLAGQREAFDVPVDLCGLTDFQRAVLEQCHRIPYGVVETYSSLALAVAGTPRSARAVGRALGANPVPILIPCHRVVRANGSLGGFSAGLHWKQFLLGIERGRECEPILTTGREACRLDPVAGGDFPGDQT